MKSLLDRTRMMQKDDLDKQRLETRLVRGHLRWSGAEIVRTGNRAEEAEERLQMVDLLETVAQA